VLFDSDLLVVAVDQNYSPFDVAGDGQHFLSLLPSDALRQSSALKVVLNWTAALNKK
jgi:hypothetical protein